MKVFAKAHTIGKNAAVELPNLVDRCLGTILLEGIKCFPDVHVRQRQADQFGFGVSFAIYEVSKKVEERQVVDEFGRLIGIKAGPVSRSTCALTSLVRSSLDHQSLNHANKS